MSLSLVLPFSSPTSFVEVSRASEFVRSVALRCVEKELIYKVPSLGPHHSPLPCFDRLLLLIAISSLWEILFDSLLFSWLYYLTHHNQFKRSITERT